MATDSRWSYSLFFVIFISPSYQRCLLNSKVSRLFTGIILRSRLWAVANPPLVTAMTAGVLLFVVCGIACIAGALTTVSATNPVRAAMGLLATIVGIAGLFLKLDAQFLAAIQLIVYAGAVVVLFVFVIMLLGSDADAEVTISKGARGAKMASGGLLAVMLGGIFVMLQPRGEAVSTPLLLSLTAARPWKLSADIPAVGIGGSGTA